MRISDWSSDVCSSDLRGGYQSSPATSRMTARKSSTAAVGLPLRRCKRQMARPGSSKVRSRGTISPVRISSSNSDIARKDRKSVVEGKSVSVRVDLGGRSIIKKKELYKKKND